MANEKPQNLQNHTRLVAPFHMFVLPVLLLNAGSTIYRVIKDGVSFQSILAILVAFALLTLALFARVFALTVQDRVIRLEMRLRLAELLSPDLRSRIPEFTVAQLVSMRFASDAELPALARKVLDEKMNDRKAIKQQVKNWQGDFLRA
ncbi:MAG TPA: DUF6526 family protein [Verrucomicrobiae bacterium]|jgi:hypothetical protein|nr:DUF6526 family protein [Verrucomicrobiae bacterium]